MSDETKAAVENLFCALFVDMLELARVQGITVKRMRELLPVVQLKALEKAGLSQLDIVAESGYTRKWVRKILDEALPDDDTNPLDRFVSCWAADPRFPRTIAIEGEYPSFFDLHDLYGGDITVPSLIRMLKEREIVSINGEQITLDDKREVTSSSGVDQVRAAQSSLTALFSTLKHNLSSKSEPMTERRLWSHLIPESELPELRQKVREANSEHYQKILDILAEHQIEVSSEDNQCLPAVGLGMYWFERRNS